MSVCICHRCGQFVDTDFNVEGVFEAVKPWKYYCGSCVERAFEDGETAETDRALAAYKADAPAEYDEMIECRRSDEAMRAAKAEYDATPSANEMKDSGRLHPIFADFFKSMGAMR